MSASAVVLAVVGNCDSYITHLADSKLLNCSTLIVIFFSPFSFSSFLSTLPVGGQKVHKKNTLALSNQTSEFSSDRFEFQCQIIAVLMPFECHFNHTHACIYRGEQ